MALITAQMIQGVQNLIGDVAASKKGDILAQLNSRLQEIASKHLWKELFRDITVALPAGSEEVFLPKTVDKIIVFKADGTPRVLVAQEEAAFQRRHAATSGSTGQPFRYRWVGEESVKEQPANPSTISIESSNVGDLSETLRIWGDVNGEEDAIDPVLLGQTPVISTKVFSRVTRISKDADTLGTITIKETAGGKVLATLGPLDSEVRYKRLKIHEVPSSASTGSLTIQKRVRYLESDNDIPELDVDEILIVGAFANMLYINQQFDKALVQEAKFKGLIADKLSEETQLTDSNVQFTPGPRQRG